MKKLSIGRWAAIPIMAVAAAVSLHASAYKIPEQSLRSVGLSAAYVAGADSADADYYNPANMGWLGDGQHVEGGVSLIHLDAVEFKGRLRGIPADGESRRENFLVPTLHYVGPKFGHWRFGCSLTTPGGLSRRWPRQPQRSTAEEFTLAIVEFNPAFSYTFNDRWSVGGGVRVIYSDGTVRIYGEDNLGHFLYADNMTGDSFDFGYNLALSYRPQPATTLSVTYRSQIDMGVSGNAKGGGPVTGRRWFDVDADVKVPLPATLAVAGVHDFGRIRLEAVYERTFWSAYDKLDFNFDDPVVEASPLGRSVQKDWEDTDTLRVGLTWHVRPDWDMLFGYAYDPSPVPEKSVGFELPDSQAYVFSVGSVIQVNKRWEAGFAMLYDKKRDRTVSTPPNENGIDGEFSSGGAYLVTLSIGCKF